MMGEEAEGCQGVVFTPLLPPRRRPRRRRRGRFGASTLRLVGHPQARRGCDWLREKGVGGVKLSGRGGAARGGGIGISPTWTFTFRIAGSNSASVITMYQF